MNIKFSLPTEEDYAEFAKTLLSSTCLDGRIKLTAEEDGHTAELFVDKETVERLGEEYIRSHVTMRYLDFTGKYHLALSENDYYNDPTRNPEKIIKVSFVRIEEGSGREIYKDVDTGKYYMRESFYPRETFARWYGCGARITIDDGYEVRPNLIFQNGEQREKVRYDDWNGVAAYGDTFNKNFGEAQE